MTLPVIPQDKANHALYGALLALAVLALCTVLGIQPAALYALGAAVIAGAGKEVVDRLENLRAEKRGEPPPHGVELWDALATWAGGGIVFVAAWLQ
jgi:hypothetical protein